MKTLKQILESVQLFLDEDLELMNWALLDVNQDYTSEFDQAVFLHLVYIQNDELGNFTLLLDSLVVGTDDSDDVYISSLNVRFFPLTTMKASA